MPALNYNHLNARTDTVGRNFTIIFATAAVVVVTLCLIFGFVVPKIRKRRDPCLPSSQFPSPSQTNVSAGIASRDFPSHPALCRDVRKRPSGQLRQYDPRCATPFPTVPPLGESISMPSITPRNHAAADVHQTSDSLFSPAKDRPPPQRGTTVEEAYMDHNFAATGTTNDPNYSLALPEPCLLRARSAGKAPPLRRQLDRFPMPRSGSGQTGKLAHPNKLFRDLELRDSKTSISTPTPLPPDDEYDASCIGQAFSTKQGGPSTGRAKKAGKKNGNTLDLPQEYEMKHWRLRRLERRGTWSSNADTVRDRFKIQRAGTISKAKTPVAEVHPIHDNNNTVEPPSSKHGTATSSEYQNSTCSTRIDSGTPPTSPVDVPKLNALPKISRDDLETPTPYLGYDRATPSSMALPSTDRLAPMCTIPEGKQADAKRASIFRQVRPLARNRPARLNLTNLRKSPSLRQRVQRHSMSSVGSLLVPLVESKRPSVQVSSVYSRDTLGVSFIHSPVSPAFSENTSTGASNEPGPIHRKASSLDLLKTKIDDWRLDTPEIENFSASPSSEFKRALSDLGPYSPTFPDSGFGSVYRVEKNIHERAEGAAQKDVPTICIGRASDDIFRDPSPDIESGRVLKRILDVEVAASMSSLPQDPKKGTAPGGADWL